MRSRSQRRTDGESERSIDRAPSPAVTLQYVTVLRRIGAPAHAPACESISATSASNSCTVVPSGADADHSDAPCATCAPLTRAVYSAGTTARLWLPHVALQSVRLHETDGSHHS